MVFDTLGSCVGRDIFRYSDQNKVEISIQRNPISTLLGGGIKFQNSFEQLITLPNYEKRMLIENLTKKSLDSLLKSSAEWLVVDLIEERFATCVANDKGWFFAPQVTSEYKNSIEKIFNAININYKYVNINDLDYDEIKKTYIEVINKLKTKYQESKIIIVEAYLVNDCLGNDSLLTKKDQVAAYDKTYIDKINAHLERLYKILFELLPNSAVVRFPKNTICSLNHLWGFSPMHYTDNYYKYAAEAIDIITKQKMTHTLEQLYNEQCLQNQILKDSINYKNLIDNKNKKLKINILGSCVSRDIFRFSDNYEVDLNIERNPISDLMKPAINITQEMEDFAFNNYEKRMMLFNLKKQALNEILKSKTEWLIIDITEERWARCVVELKDKTKTKTFMPMTRPEYINVVKNLLNKIEATYKVIDYKDINYDDLENSFKIFSEKLLKSYDPKKIIICESYYADKYINNDGTISNFNAADNAKVNGLYKKAHELIYKYLPDSHIIKFPTNTLGSCNHLWPWSPLHYTDDYYKYAAEAVDIITKRKMTHTLEQLYNEQCLKNNLFIENIELKSNQKSSEEKIFKLNEENDLLKKENKRISDSLEELKALFNNYYSDYEKNLTIGQKVKRYKNQYGLKKTIKRAFCKIFKRNKNGQ